MKILVTGGCGFIGSNYLNVAVRNYPNITFHNIDRLDYCASLSNLTVRDYINYKFYELVLAKDILGKGYQDQELINLYISNFFPESSTKNKMLIINFINKIF